MKAREFSAKHELTSAQVTEALKEMRGTDGRPNSGVTLTDKEASELLERFDIKESPVCDIEEAELLKMEREQLESAKEEFAREREQFAAEQESQTSQLDRIENALSQAESIDNRANMIKRNNTSTIPGRQIKT